MVRVDIWLPDPAGALSAGAFGPGALIRIERADLDVAPPYDLGAYSEVHTLTVLASSLQYQWWDDAGIATSSYRWRISDAGAATFSEYSDPFTGTNPAGSVMPRSYASLDQALALFETQPNVTRQRRLATALGTATDELIAELSGRDYFRHPAAGVSTWSPGPYDVDGSVLHVHTGIISVDTLTLNGTATTAYRLTGSAPGQGLDPAGNEPAFHIELTSGRFPRDPALTAVTGARGWPAIPSALAEACAARARQIVYADPSYAGVVPGPPEYSGAVMTERWPQVLYRFMQREKARFVACLFANS